MGVLAFVSLHRLHCADSSVTSSVPSGNQLSPIQDALVSHSRHLLEFSGRTKPIQAEMRIVSSKLRRQLLELS